MDMQTCRICEKEFDFDTEGLGTERDDKPFIVCGSDCAKQAASQAGKDHAIHDQTGAIVETNAPQDGDGCGCHIVNAKTGQRLT